MMKSRHSRVITALAAVVVATAAAVVGCATPSRIGPTTQPGGIQTPEITFPAPGGGIPDLPPGFHPCDEYTAPVTLNDGSTVTLHGCVYCADNPNDHTVYVQPNCSGLYFKGIRHGVRDGGFVPINRLVNVSGDVSQDSSDLSFTARAAFDVVRSMTDFGDGLIIAGRPISKWVALGVTSFPANTQVSIKGGNIGIADVLYWGFGAGDLAATVGSTGDDVVLQVGYSSFLGPVVVPFVNGTADLTDAGFIPWRGD